MIILSDFFVKLKSNDSLTIKNLSSIKTNLTDQQKDVDINNFFLDEIPYLFIGDEKLSVHGIDIEYILLTKN